MPLRRWVGRPIQAPGTAAGNDGISVKLSALNCRYEPLQREHALADLIAT
jgi:hypothetical protein